MVATARKTLMAQNYTRQWQRTKINPQAQHIIPLKILQENNCRSVIDLGCGHGQFLYLCKKSGMQVHGLELSEGGVHQAQERYGIENVRQFDLDDENLDLPFDTNALDYSVTIGCPESILNMEPFMREFLRIGRRSILVVPNFAQLGRRVGLLRKGRHGGFTSPEVTHNFVNLSWILFHVKNSGAHVRKFLATYPHGGGSGIFRDDSPRSQIFAPFIDDPSLPVPWSYRLWSRILSVRPTLFARFFIFELEKQKDSSVR